MIDIKQFAESFEELLAEKPDLPEFLERGKILVGRLVSDQHWLKNILSLLILDEAFLHSRQQTADPNDIIIYRSPTRSFSVRAFIWQPRIMHNIHDHGAWGIVGACINQVKEKKFWR